jgi:YCII-like protein
MYVIDIKITEQTNETEAAERLAQHRAWFKKYFEAGNFLVVGPYLDRKHAGMVLAQAESREALDKILAEDAYYPDGAEYAVSEYQANLIADNITDYRGK